MPDHLAHLVQLEHPAPPEKREMLDRREHRVTLDYLEHKDRPVKMARLVIPEKKEQQVITELQELLASLVTMVKREHPAYQVKMDIQVGLAFLEKMDIPELLDPKVQKVNLAHPAILSHPKSLALLVYPDILARMELQDTLADLALLDLQGRLDYKDLPANPEQMDILEGLVLKATLGFRATLELQEKMDIPVLQAKFPARPGLKGLLELLVTMALLARMVSLVALDIQEKMESLALPDTLVRLVNQERMVIPARSELLAIPVGQAQSDLKVNKDFLVSQDHRDPLVYPVH